MRGLLENSELEKANFGEICGSQAFYCTKEGIIALSQTLNQRILEEERPGLSVILGGTVNSTTKLS